MAQLIVEISEDLAERLREPLLLPTDHYVRLALEVAASHRDEMKALMENMGPRTPPPAIPRRAWTVQEAATELRLSTDSVYRLVKARKLRAVHSGSRISIPDEAMRAYKLSG